MYSIRRCKVEKVKKKMRKRKRNMEKRKRKAIQNMDIFTELLTVNHPANVVEAVLTGVNPTVPRVDCMELFSVYFCAWLDPLKVLFPYFWIMCWECQSMKYKYFFFFLFQSIPPLQKCCSVLLSFGNRILTIESGEGTHCIYVCN